MENSRHLEVLASLCNLPTAPYCEQHVIAWLLRWARERRKYIRARRDRAGNVYLEYGWKSRGRTTMVVEAHMDHPGFVVVGPGGDGVVKAEFRGSVRPSHFKGARVRFWVNEPPATGRVRPVEARGRWVKAKVISVRQIRGRQFLEVKLGGVKEWLAPGTLGMWDLPEASVKGEIFAARVCDDLAGVAAIVCMIEELIDGKVDAHVIGLCTRAEEVGFAGVLAVCESGWVKVGGGS